MTLVSGDIKLLTPNPAQINAVWVRSSEMRIHGQGLMVDMNDTISVVGGVVEFPAIPGPAVMVLLSNGNPVRTVKMIILDKANASLAECIRAAELVNDGTLSALELLAEEVASVFGDASTVLHARDEATDAAAKAQRWANAAAGILTTETAPGSGLYLIGGPQVTLAETVPGSGLYMIGVA